MFVFFWVLGVYILGLILPRVVPSGPVPGGLLL